MTALPHISYPNSFALELAAHGFESLTPRERTVLNWIINGAKNKEIARELGISPRTVEAHRLRLMQKIGARNGAQLAHIVSALMLDNHVSTRGKPSCATGNDFAVD